MPKRDDLGFAQSYQSGRIAAGNVCQLLPGQAGIFEPPDRIFFAHRVITAHHEAVCPHAPDQHLQATLNAAARRQLTLYSA